jgi:hypothetical protein
LHGVLRLERGGKLLAQLIIVKRVKAGTDDGLADNRILRGVEAVLEGIEGRATLPLLGARPGGPGGGSAIGRPALFGDGTFIRLSSRFPLHQ